MRINRAATNPVITPKDVIPSHRGFTVVGAFNPAATRYGDETLLLLRVAETANCAADEIAVPMLDCEGPEPYLRVERILRNTPGLDLSDTRAVVLDDRMLLTSISHLRLARSRDGVNFTVDPEPAIFPYEPYEEYGVEDPRISCIGDTYWIMYTAVSRWGITVALASTADFITYSKHGIIFNPDNKDVAIFPAKIDGRYYALHRPSTNGIGRLQIWLSSSPDMFHWGNHRPLIGIRPGMWDGQRIGAGDVPVKTDAGWLTIYHGVNAQHGYCLGGLLLDGENPYRVLARSAEALLLPEMDYERNGFYGKVVFTCGTVLDEHNDLHIYYGAADETTCHASVPVEDVLAHMEPVSPRCELPITPAISPQLTPPSIEQLIAENVV